MFYWFIKALAWPIVTAYLRFRRYGRGRVPGRGACLVVANHASYLDAICLGSASPRKLRFLISADIYRMLRLRWFYFMMDAIPLRTEGADTRALRIALQALRRGEAIGVFPEGQRMPDGRIGEGKTGVAFLAARSGAPVVPAAIIGAHRAMPVGSFFPRPFPVKVVFGEPIRFPEGGERAGREELAVFANRVMDAIAELGSGDAAPASERVDAVGERRS